MTDRKMEEAIGKAQAIARELRCDVTCKRCLDFGCRHEGALDKDNLDYRCPSCAAYTFLLTTWPPALPETAGTRTLQDAVQSREFYDLMQSYRHMPMDRPAYVVEAFESVKTFLLARQASVPPVTTTVFRECYSHGDDAITAPPAAAQTPLPDET